MLYRISGLESRRMKWVGYIVHMEEKRNTKFWSEYLKGRNLEDLDIDGITTLEWIFWIFKE
jgi:hypothetical protein